MAHLELPGFKATFGEHERMPDQIDDILDELKDAFQGEGDINTDTLKTPGDVDTDSINNFLFRSSRDRQRILDNTDIVEFLSKNEHDIEIMKDVIRCMGNFPIYEKEYLKNILSSTLPDKAKFLFLAESIFSKTPKLLHEFRAAKGTTHLNEEIVSSLENEEQRYPNEHIINAVKAVLVEGKTKTSEVFPSSDEMYEIEDEQQALNMKFIYDQCRCEEKRYLPRKVFLKKLLLKADGMRDVILVSKIVLSHCDVDLGSILGKIKGSDTKEIPESDNMLVPEIRTLKTLESINNEHLRELVRIAAFGLD